MADFTADNTLGRFLVVSRTGQTWRIIGWEAAAHKIRVVRYPHGAEVGQWPVRKVLRSLKMGWMNLE